MVRKIEAAVDAGETLTPGALDAAKERIIASNRTKNLGKLARDLEAAGMLLQEVTARDGTKKIVKIDKSALEHLQQKLALENWTLARSK